MSRRFGEEHEVASRARAARGRMRSIAVCLAVVAAIMPFTARPADRYEGLAYVRGSDRLVYREVHWLYVKDGVAQQLVLYHCPDGAPFARRLIRELPNAIAPDFDFLDGRDGRHEGVRTQAGGREVFYQENKESPLRTARLAARPEGVIDAGFDAFVRAHWDELSRDDSLEAPFLVPSRLEFLDFRIFDAQNGLWHGRKVLRVRMGLAAWYAFALPSIELTYEPHDRHLLEYQGIGAISDSRGRNQNVRIEFPDGARASGLPLDEVRPAATAPLTGRCFG